MDQDVDNISEEEFKLGYWFFAHKDLFKKILIWFLVILVLAFWGYSLVRWIQILATNKSHREMLINLSEADVSHQVVLNSGRPADLEIVKLHLIPSGKTFDVVVELKNPNLRWGAKTFSYNLMADGASLAQADSFILPLEEKYIAMYDIELINKTARLDLVVNDVVWQRIKDFKDFKRPDFTVANQRVDDLSTISGQAINGTRLDFNITNNGPYSYWRVDLIVLLFSGGQMVAVGNQPIRIFDSGQTKNVEMAWPATIPNVSEVVVKASVNTLIPEVFKTISSFLGHQLRLVNK